jgi:cytochrome c oxidase subunit 2
MGEELYVDNCAACHQEGGEGTGAYPMLDGNPFVTQDPEQPIRRIINGRGAMPGFGNSLSDEEIAAIVSYIGNAWTNDASVVMPDQVQQARE